MTGRELMERRLYLGLSRAETAAKCLSVTEADIAAAEAADLKCSAAIERFFSTVILPSGPRANVSTPPAA